MSLIVPSVNSFTSGELTPKMLGRFDLQAYHNGCTILENSIILPFGSTTRRPGTIYMGEAKYPDRKCRLLKFKFSSSIYCMIEFGHEYMRFWTENGAITLGSSPYEVAHPYQESDLFDIHIGQSADTIFFAHKDYYPMKLVRNDTSQMQLKCINATDWEMSRVVFSLPPFRDMNVTDTSFTVGEAGTLSTTVTASEDIFTDGDFHSLWTLSQPRTDNTLDGEFTENEETTEWIQCYRGFNLLTHGVWNGSVVVQQSEDNGVTPVDVRSFGSSDDYNVNWNGNEEHDGMVYRLKFTTTKTSSEDIGKCKYEFTVDEHYIDCAFKIMKVTDARNVDVEFKWRLPCNTTATKLWRKAAWSLEYGYPSTVFIHEERLGWAANKEEPDFIWMSKTNDWYDFTVGDLDTDALVFSPPSSEVLQWVLSGQALLIGTEGVECVLGDYENNSPLTPSAIPKINKQSANGSSHLQAIMVSDCVLYTQSYSKIVNEFAYTFAENKFNSPNMTLLAPHITGEGLTQMDCALHPETLLWATRKDGQVVTFTYNREQSVLGWARHIIGGGKAESVAVIPNNTVNEDSPWFSVKRTINGEDVRYIERMDKREYDTIRDCKYVDCSMSFYGGDNLDLESISFDEPTTFYTVVTKTAHGLEDGNDVKLYDCGSLSYRVLPKIEVIDSTSFKSYYDEFTFEITDDSYCNRVENTFTNLGHLEGQAVKALIDGAASAEKTVVDGEVIFEEYGNKVHIGINQKAITSPMPIVSKIQGGFSEPHPLTLTRVGVKFFETMGAYIKVSTETNPEGSIYIPEWRTVDNDIGLAIEPKNQVVDKLITTPQTGREVNIQVVQDEPLPMTILNIFPEFTINAI